MAPVENQVFPLLRACREPAARLATDRLSHPGCRIVSQTARRDLERGDCENLMFLAAGVAIAAATVAELAAGRRGLAPLTFLDLVEAGLAEESDESTDRLLGTLRGFFAEDGPTPPEVLGRAWGTSQEGFLDLVVELGEFAATLIDLLTGCGAHTDEEITAEIEDALGGFSEEE